MNYLDFDRIEAIVPREFQDQKPFPWINPAKLLTDEGYWSLVETLPDVSLFEADFGRERRFGQQSHDRHTLEYREDLAISEPWQQFIAELRGDRYRGFLASLFGQSKFKLRFHWHYAPKGGSVSPHCDSKRKLGSHLFYMNSSRDWDPAWGGETVVLDDGGRFSHGAGPAFEDFEGSIEATYLDNMSLIFRRTAHSWHGVREVTCPDDQMRKIFIVVIDDWRLSQRFLSGRRKRQVESY